MDQRCRTADWLCRIAQIRGQGASAVSSRATAAAVYSAIPAGLSATVGSRAVGLPCAMGALGGTAVLWAVVTLSSTGGGVGS
jgi:hypothetical protein